MKHFKIFNKFIKNFLMISVRALENDFNSLDVRVTKQDRSNRLLDWAMQAVKQVRVINNYISYIVEDMFNRNHSLTVY